MTKIQVVDSDSRQVLFECPVDEAEKAYNYAADLENMGLSIEVLNPTLSQTLSHSLGLGPEAHAEFEQSMEEEIEHHEGSCCFKDPESDTQH